MSDLIDLLSPTGRQRFMTALQAIVNKELNNADAEFTAELQHDLTPADISQLIFFINLLDVIESAIPNHTCI